MKLREADEPASLGYREEIGIYRVHNKHETNDLLKKRAGRKVINQVLEYVAIAGQIYDELVTNRRIVILVSLYPSHHER